jgi:hypothetical protein
MPTRPSESRASTHFPSGLTAPSVSGRVTQDKSHSTMDPVQASPEPTKNILSSAKNPVKLMNSIGRVRAILAEGSSGETK